MNMRKDEEGGERVGVEDRIGVKDEVIIGGESVSADTDPVEDVKQDAVPGYPQIGYSLSTLIADNLWPLDELDDRAAAIALNKQKTYCRIVFPILDLIAFDQAMCDAGLPTLSPQTRMIAGLALMVGTGVYLKTMGSGFGGKAKRRKQKRTDKQRGAESSAAEKGDG